MPIVCVTDATIKPERVGLVDEIYALFILESPIINTSCATYGIVVGDKTIKHGSVYSGWY